MFFKIQNKKNIGCLSIFILGLLFYSMPSHSMDKPNTEKANCTEECEKLKQKMIDNMALVMYKDASSLKKDFDEKQKFQNAVNKPANEIRDVMAKPAAEEESWLSKLGTGIWDFMKTAGTFILGLVTDPLQTIGQLFGGIFSSGKP